MTMSPGNRPDTSRALDYPPAQQATQDNMKLHDIAERTHARATVQFEESNSPKTSSIPKVVTRKTYTNGEKLILAEINKCFKNWYKPWHRCYLEDGPKFSAVHDLMEDLLHYEQQIDQCELGLPEERVTAIAKAVARLIDYGNAILDIDITIRASDDSFRELDPISMTTIELYRAHVSAQRLRDKLLENYFKRNKQAAATATGGSPGDAESPTNGGSPSFTNQQSASSTLRLPHSASTWSFPSPTMDRSQRFSIGSNSSINTLGGGGGGGGGGTQTSQFDYGTTPGRKTPQSANSSFIEVKTMSPSTEDLTESQLEMRHMIATLRSEAFSNLRNSSLRHTLLQGALAKVESLLTMPSDPEKLVHCFELLDTLLDVVERMPAETRQEEVALVAKSLFMTLMRKVHLVSCDDLVEFQRAHWTTHLLALIRMMSMADFGLYLKNFTCGDLRAFLTEYLFIIERLISSQQHYAEVDNAADMQHDHIAPIYPTCWIEMSLMACATLQKSLIYLYSILRQNFGTNTQMWQSYFDCLVRFILQEPLRKDRATLKTRQQLRADDLRFTAADYIWIAWDSLDSQPRFSILESLVEPLLRACMSLGSRHRSILLPIFYNMMQCDYTSQYVPLTSGQPTGGGGSTTCRSQLVGGVSDIQQQQQQQQRHQPQYDFQCSDPIASRLYEEDFEAGQYQRRPSLTTTTATTSDNELDFFTTNHHQAGARMCIQDESLPYLSFRDQNSICGSPLSGSNNRSASDDSTVLTKFTHLIIDKLNALMIDKKLGDEQFKSELCAAIAGDLHPIYARQPEDARAGCNRIAGASDATSALSSSSFMFANSADAERFKSMARHTANLVSEFMQICLDSRQAERYSYNHLHLLCLFKLILFFRDKVDVVGLYSANLHKLWCIHNTAGRFAEAGFTLLEHAKSLEWSSKPLEKHHLMIAKSFQAPEALTDHMNLKQVLYVTIIEYFDQSQLWELAVPLCRELCDIYQFKLFDYVRLAQVHAKLSTFFQNISSGRQLRSHPEYFRVGFFGCGFPASLQNCTMIYRGRPFEKLGDFQATLLSKYPDAQLLKTLGQPDERLLEEPGAKYLQINACSPLVDLPAKFQRSVSASRGGCGPEHQFIAQPTASPIVNTGELQDYIVSYYKHNECDKFEFSRRIPPPASHSAGAAGSQPGGGGGDDFANMWRQRITLTTNTLPGMLHFFPVFLAETTTISPIECAIEDLERANDRLSCMVNRFRADKRQEEDVRALGQLLLGIVDAAVNGGITKYEQAFFGGGGGGGGGGGSHSSDGETGEGQSQQTLTPPSKHCLEPFATDQLHYRQRSADVVAQAHLNNNTNNTRSTSATCHAAVDTLRAPNDDQPAMGGQSTVGLAATERQMEKLKCLIARQVPLLDEAIGFHRDRVAEIMRPQHEHLEGSFRKLKNHVMSKYVRYLPADYNRRRRTNSTASRTLMNLSRSPNRASSIRSESRSAAASARFGHKRLSDVSTASAAAAAAASSTTLVPNRQQETTAVRNSDPVPPSSSAAAATNFPYRQLGTERRSLPFLAGVRNLSFAPDSRTSESPSSPDTPTATGSTSRPNIYTTIKYEKIPEPAAGDNYGPPPPLPPPRSRVSSLGQSESSTLLATPIPRSHLTVDNSSPYVSLPDAMRLSQANKRPDNDNPYARLLPDAEARGGDSQEDDIGSAPFESSCPLNPLL